MVRNVLSAIYTIITNKRTDIESSDNELADNRIQSVGKSLESYVKNAFADAFETDQPTRLNLYSDNFSWEGNANNPPDFMLKGGDAIEVKKRESATASIPLNSSPPKQKLVAASSMITNACRSCEDWQEKDLLYVVGHVPKKTSTLKNLWFVYGDCYAAASDVYERATNAIRNGVEHSGLELSVTNELGRINDVDPLGITYLRIRGMWGIKHPSIVFVDLFQDQDNAASNFTLSAVMREEKYNSFPQSERTALEQLQSDSFTISDIAIQSPDNPAKLITAKIIRYVV